MYTSSGLQLKKVTVKIGDTVAFQNEDFSEIGSLGNKIAFKCGSYGGKCDRCICKRIFTIPDRRQWIRSRLLQ